VTKQHQDTLKKIVTDPAYLAAMQEVLSELPVASSREILDGKFTTQQLAEQHCFTAGALFSFNELSRKGKSPKAKRPQVQARHLRTD
jgi:hypothetical protein